jgi:hypothetical protein
MHTSNITKSTKCTNKEIINNINPQNIQQIRLLSASDSTAANQTVKQAHLKKPKKPPPRQHAA